MTEIYVTNDDGKRRLLEELRATMLPYRVKITKGKRSLEQNAYLWGVVYPTFLRESGLGEHGWRAEDLHEWFLGEHFGWETLEGLGRKRVRPMNRSSDLGKLEFSDYVGFIQQKAAEMGVVIPDPERADDGS